MTLDELLEGIERLFEQHAEAQQDPGPGADNFRCVDCKGCYNCRFCVKCLRCEECNYCERSEDCAGCTQCKRCKSCSGCTHCEDSQDCVDSHYLNLCIECEECVQCLACVGLTGEEFCVLNERYTRKEYFEIAGKIRQELDARLAKGWRVPYLDLEAGEGPDTWVDESATPWDESSPDVAASPSLTRGARPRRPGESPAPEPEGEGTVRAGRRPQRPPR